MKNKEQKRTKSVTTIIRDVRTEENEKQRNEKRMKEKPEPERKSEAREKFQPPPLFPDLAIWVSFLGISS
jgi:hypothetical protein